MEYKYSTSSPFVEGNAMHIMVRSEQGLYLGAYRGFYNYRRGVVRCYPCHNPSGISLPMCDISERLITKQK